MASELDIDSLYREHGEFIARAIERMTGSGPHVDDLLQECFVAAFKSRGRYDENLASVTTWLYSIAIHVTKRHQRGQWRFSRLRQRVAQHDLARSPERPDRSVERTQAVAAVHDVLTTLPFKQREVFSLYELEGLDGPTISELVGVPEGTVWTRLHHARKSFSKRMRKKMLQEGLA